MPNISDLNEFLRPADVPSGSLIEFVNEGVIKTTNFQRDDEEEKQVLEMRVMIVATGKEKKMTLNRTNREILGEVWGQDTEEWVGKQAKVTILKQMCFGEMKSIMHLEPAE